MESEGQVSWKPRAEPGTAAAVDVTAGVTPDSVRHSGGWSAHLKGRTWWSKWSKPLGGNRSITRHQLDG